RLVFACFLSLMFFSQSVFGQASHVVISEVYGGGGNTSAPYKSDFIELYNPTGSDIAMTSWSIQYTSATGNSWGTNQVTFTGVIRSHGYFLIKLNTNGSVGADLPSSDVTASPQINISATAGKIGL